MEALLQQRRGFKRNDNPEFKFKRLVYTYHCHREGTAFLQPDLSDTENTSLKHYQQAARIYNYLNDKPAYTDTTSILPLFTSAGKKVVDATTLIVFIQEQGLFPGYNFTDNFIAVYAQDMNDEKSNNEAEKQNEKKLREGYIVFEQSYTQPNGSICKYQFEISYITLRRITDEIILQQNTAEQETADISPAEHFNGVVKGCMQMRNYLYTRLAEAGENAISFDSYPIIKEYSSIYINYNEFKQNWTELNYTADELRNYPLGSTLKTEKLLIDWHSKFVRGKTAELKARRKLLNAIRPGNVSFDKTDYQGVLKNGEPRVLPKNQLAEPVFFFESYYYREQNYKRRKADRFTEWAVRYLMDMNLLPGCLYETESLQYAAHKQDKKNEYKLKMVKQYLSELPANGRFCINSNKITIAVNRNGKLYKLLLGEDALKYMLYWHFFENTKQPDQSLYAFIQELVDDMQQIQQSRLEKQIDPGSLKLVAKKTLPGFARHLLPPPVNTEQSDLKDVLKDFINAKIKALENQLENLPSMKRSDKNRTLFNAYQLYDFSETDGKKFLRKDEYEQMSVCHYMLNQNPQQAGYLLHKVFKLNSRLPQEIYQLFIQAVNTGYIITDEKPLDRLLNTVLDDRKKFFENCLHNIETTETKILRKYLKSWHYLHIHLPDDLVTEQKKDERKNARLQNLQYLPFDIHSSLVLRYFYREQYEQQAFTGKSSTTYNLFRPLRSNNQFKLVLPASNYPADALSGVYASAEKHWPNDSSIKTHLHRITGKINDVFTKDILLLQVADVYSRQFNNEFADNIIAMRQTKKVSLRNMYQQAVIIKLNMQSVNQALHNAGMSYKLPNLVHLQLRMHQVDDYFFKMKKEQLVSLAAYFLHWRHEEAARYAHDASIAERINKWPSGNTANQALTLGDLIQANKLYATHAAELVEYILKYEAAVINYKFESTGDSLHQKLIAFCDNRVNDNRRSYYIPFSELNSWNTALDDSTRKKLKDLRNDCLHSKIPVTGSLRQLYRPGTEAASLLGITDLLGKDRLAPNLYDRSSEII